MWKPASQTEAAAWMLPRRKRPPPLHKSSNDIWSACQTGDVAYVHTAIQQSPELLHLEQKGRTPLWHACRHNHVACAALLLEAGAADDAAGSARNATTSSVLRSLLLQYQRVDEEIKSLSSSGEGEQQLLLRKAIETLETLEKSGEEEEEDEEKEDPEDEEEPSSEESASEEEEEEEVEQQEEQELVPQESFEVVEKKKKRWALPRRGPKKVNVVSSSKMVNKSATAPTTAIYSEALDTSFEALDTSFEVEDTDDFEGSKTDAAGAAAGTAAAAATMDAVLFEDASMTDSRKAIVQKNARWLSFKNGGGGGDSPLRWFQNNKSNSSSPSRSETSVDDALDVLADLELASKASTSVDFRPKKQLGQEEEVSKIDPMVDVKGDNSIAEWMTQKLPKHQVDGAESVAGLTHLGVEVDDRSKASTQRSMAAGSCAGSTSNLTHMGVEIEEDQRSAPASISHQSHRAL